MSPNSLNQLKQGKFWIEDDILFCELNQVNCFLTEANAKAFLFEIDRMIQDYPIPLVIDARKFVGNFSPDAARLFADSSILQRCITIQAFVADTLNAKLLVGSYSRIYGDNAHIKIFNKIDSAITYCLDFKNKFYVSNC